ncbi:hypothetical protein G7046_g6597 [Stylonectria norvegica]|nr:hypothetical protein G7046_g6597 [Stylonectria norvegica]
MGREDDSSNNVFVRFKHHVDGSIASGFNTVLRSPPAASSQAQDSVSSDPADSGALSSDTKVTVHPMASSSPSRPPTTTNLFDMLQARHDPSMSAVALSPYSPLALRSLPQPVPSDAPSYFKDSAIFTFEDAFEDLLAVSQGQPLPNITTRYEQKKLIRSMFPNGEPAWFWLRRLTSQGLLETPGPGHLLSMATDPSNWEFLHRELDRRAADVWRAAPHMSEDPGEQARDVYQEMEPARKVEERFPWWDSATERSDTDSRRHQRREPDHFDDFFSSIQSTFADGQKSWDTFMKSIIDDHPTSYEKPQHQPRLDQEANSNNEVVSKEEYVDRLGYLHSKVTVKTFDEDGNQIASKSHWSLRPADADPGKPDDAGIDGKESGGRQESKTGWFWK